MEVNCKYFDVLVIYTYFGFFFPLNFDITGGGGKVEELSRLNSVEL